MLGKSHAASADHRRPEAGSQPRPSEPPASITQLRLTTRALCPAEHMTQSPNQEAFQSRVPAGWKHITLISIFIVIQRSFPLRLCTSSSLCVVCPNLHFFKDIRGFSCGSAGKESACNAGDLGSIPGLERSPGEGNGYPLQYSGLQNSMDYAVNRVAKSQTQLIDFHIQGHQSVSSVMSDSLWPHGL